MVLGHAVFHCEVGRTLAGVIGAPACIAAIAEGSRLALPDDVSAHRAFAGSIQYSGRADRSADAAFPEGKMPVYLVNGSADPMAPPATLDEFCETYPWIEMQQGEEAVAFAFFGHWGEVFGLINRPV